MKLRPASFSQPNRRRWLILALFFILATVSLLGWRLLRPSDDAWARLLAGGSLRVAVDPSFPPFDDVDADGTVVGFDIDLAHELGRRLGVPVEFKTIAFDGLVDAVLAGQADVVISAFPLDPRLTKDVRYSQPYFEAGLVAVERVQGLAVEPETLAERRIAVEWGSQGDAWARAQGLEVLRQETAAAAIAAVTAGDADVALVDAVTAALNTAPDLRIYSPPLDSEPYVIVLPLDAPKLAEITAAILADIMADGTWERLAGNYFRQAPPKPIDEDVEK